MISVKFYRNSSEKNKIGKTLTNELSLSGTLRESTDLINPVITVEAESMVNYNYAHIAAFGRYYFIERMEVVRTGLWRVYLSVDVLESFKTSIKNQMVIIEASEENGASDHISGHQWVSKVKTLTDIVNFSSGLNESGEYILITVGG